MDTSPRLLEISLLHPLVLSNGGRIVPPGRPVWRSPTPAPSEIDTDQSDETVAREARSRPGAAVFVQDQGDLRLQISLPAGTAGAGYRLEGGYPGHDQFFQLFAGTARADDGQVILEIDVSLVAEPLEWLALVNRPVTWKLFRERERDQPLMTLATVLELYWLVRDPSHWFGRGIPVALLRDITDGLSNDRSIDIEWAAGRVGYALEEPRPSWSVARIVRWLFRRTPPRYDTVGGGNYYTILEYPDFNHVVLLLSRYLHARADHNAICNCYDMAAVLQVYLRMLGLWDTRYCFMRPFGYLKKDGLLGRGPCNNPFSDDGDATPRLVPESAPSRTAFGNHAFCYLPGPRTVADACTGSHPGDQSVEEYVATAVDSQYPEAPASPGTADDIEYCDGVIAIDTMRSPALSRTLDQVEELRAAIGHDQAMKKRPGGQRIVARWPDPLTCPAIDAGQWTIVYQELLIGPEECNRHWLLKRDRETIAIDIYLAGGVRDLEVAEDRFLQMAAVHNMERSIAGPGPSWLGHSSAMYERPGQGWYSWLFHNASFRVRSHGASLDGEAIAHWLQDIATGSLAATGDSNDANDANDANAGLQMPDTDEVQISTTELAVGQELTVRIEPALGYRLGFRMLDSASGNPAIHCVADEDCELRFAARAASSGTLEVIVVDPVTLLSSRKTISIDVRLDLA